MDPNVRGSGRGPPNPPGPSRLESQVDMPPPNPSLTSTWGHGIGSLHIPHSQNVNNPVVGGRNVNVYVNCSDGEAAQTANPQQENVDDLTMTSRADHEIYSSQLLTKKRGFPLWVPGPGMQLPIEYRRQGISIGDVGIITSTEGFDFLFNIFLPADHPINGGMVPQGFSPISRQGLERDIHRTAGYGPNTHLASASVRQISAHLISETESIDHRFESTAKEAAILVMPDGATTQNLLNTGGVRSYISSKAKDWYTYATDTRGRDVKNGDIRVVVGTDKVSSWGIATSACNTGQTASYVFKHDSTHAYKWECTGGSGRVGPLRVETCDLIEDDTVLENQCVFVRTINFTLSGRIRNDFPLDSAVKQTGSGSGNYGRRGSSSGNRGSRGRRGNSGRGSSSSGRPLDSMQGSSRCTRSVTFDPIETGVNHPSTALHNCLHEKFPDADIIITEDLDWISVLNDGDVVFPEPDDLCARILEAQELRTQGFRNDFIDDLPFIKKAGDKIKRMVVSSCTIVQASRARRSSESTLFWCTECGASFTRKHNLTNHMNSHLENKDHVSRCGKSFVTISGMKRHQDKCPKCQSRVLTSE